MRPKVVNTDVGIATSTMSVPRFDRYRLVGIAGRVNTSQAAPTALLSGEQSALEQIAPGSGDAYQPVAYGDNAVAVVGYDPWISADGRTRP